MSRVLPRVLPRVMLQGRLVRTRQARISPFGEGFMFGRGVFETIKVVGGRPLFLADHLNRLRLGAFGLGLLLSTSDRQFAEQCDRVVSANRLRNGNLKIVVFQDESGIGELILARRGLYPTEAYARGFLLRIELETRSDAVYPFKTLNYMDNIAARRRAVAAGFDEALFINARGEVLEGSSTNIFTVEGSRVITPPLALTVLEGTARARVIALLGPKRVAERPLPLKRLLKASEVFVTNAILGVMPVSQIGDRRYSLRRNPVTRALMAAYAAVESEAASQRRTRPAKKSIAGG